MFVSVPFPMKSSGGGSASGFVRKRKLKVDGGKDWYEFTTSGSWDRDALLAIVTAEPGNEGLTLAQVRVEAQAIGGGGGGNSGAYAGIGGFPGVVTYTEFQLSDLNEGDDLYIDIGAGGAAGSDGGTSLLVAHNMYVRSGSGVAGVGADGVRDAYYRHLAADGKSVDPDAGNSAMNSATGPAGGGSNRANNYTGGIGRSASPYTVLPGFSAGENGHDGTNTFGENWDNYGSGGAGAPFIDDETTPTTGGNGGYPGAGGGAGLVGGAGANGCVRFRFSVLEPA